MSLRTAEVAVPALVGLGILSIAAGAKAARARSMPLQQFPPPELELEPPGPSWQELEPPPAPPVNVCDGPFPTVSTAGLRRVTYAEVPPEVRSQAPALQRRQDAPGTRYELGDGFVAVREYHCNEARGIHEGVSILRRV